MSVEMAFFLGIGVGVALCASLYFIISAIHSERWWRQEDIKI